MKAARGGRILAPMGFLRWLFSFALVMIGLAGILSFGAFIAWPYISAFTGLSFTLPTTNFAVSAVPALAGMVFIMLGVRMAFQQREISRFERRQKEDRQRRVRLRQYGDPTQRVEPYIGS